MPDKFVRISDEEAAQMLEQIASEDIRKEGATVAILIRREFDRRHPKMSIAHISNEPQPEATERVA